MNIKKSSIVVLALLQMACASIHKERKHSKPFTFVQLCDTQLGMGGYEHDMKTFKQAVRQINEIKPDFALICGDLVKNATDSSYADFKSILSELKVPCYLAAGNHDVGNIPTEATLKYYRNVIGKDYFVFQNKGVAFVVANTQLWKVNVTNESAKHNQWFENTLDSLTKGNTPIFVIGHYPLFLDTPEEKETYFNLPLEIRGGILSIFKENNVKAYLSGHTHKTIINNFENIQMVSGETTSKNFDKRPFGFRLWTVNADSILHKFVSLKKYQDTFF